MRKYSGALSLCIFDASAERKIGWFDESFCKRQTNIRDGYEGNSLGFIRGCGGGTGRLEKRLGANARGR